MWDRLGTFVDRHVWKLLGGIAAGWLVVFCSIAWNLGD